MKKLAEIEQNSPEKPLKDDEIVFIEAYLKYFSKTKAAKIAGSQSPNLGQVGYNIYNKPHIKAEIKRRLSENALSAEENIDLINRSAKANVKDYFKPVTYFESKKVKVSLRIIIKNLKRRIEELDEFYYRAKDLTEGESKQISANIKNIEREILRHEITLEGNSRAYEIVTGPLEEVIKYELDVNALVADQEKGIVKSVKYTENGIQLEMVDPMVAQMQIAKINGSYEKDNSQKTAVINNNLSVERIKEISKKLNDAV